MEAPHCPREKGLEILAGKWVLFILRALRKPRTFSELQHEYTIITNHILSQELHKLIEERLVEHHDELYHITPSGEALLAATEPLHKWAVKHCNLQACPKELACSDCAEYIKRIEQSKTS